MKGVLYWWSCISRGIKRWRIGKGFLSIFHRRNIIVRQLKQRKLKMTSDFFESLLWMSESESLDFKQDQYPFDGGSEEQKSELLKDILAFANSWRNTDAYILIGIKEKRGERAELLGVNNHIISNNLQQFVDAKTNKPIRFTYAPFTYDKKQVGILKIPVQRRPFFLKSKYGKLEAEVVYIRRGDATVKAKPDEISQMGHSQMLSEISTGPELEGKINFEFSHRPGNPMCKLTLNILISNNSPHIPSLNTKAKLSIGNHPLDLIKESLTIHYGDPFYTFQSYEIPVPDMYTPRLQTYRLTYGSDQCALRISEYNIKITTASLLGPYGVIRYAEEYCKFDYEVVHENIFIHEVQSKIEKEQVNLTN